MKSEKIGPTFSSFNALPAKITKWLIVLPGGICLVVFHNSKGAFCIWTKSLNKK